MVPVLDSIDHCSSPRGSAAEALAHNAWFLQEASGAQGSSARGGVDGDVVVLVAGQPYRYLLCVSLSVLLRCLPSQHARAAACGMRQAGSGLFSTLLAWCPPALVYAAEVAAIGAPHIVLTEGSRLLVRSFVAFQLLH